MLWGEVLKKTPLPAFLFLEELSVAIQIVLFREQVDWD